MTKILTQKQTAEILGLSKQRVNHLMPVLAHDDTRKVSVKRLAEYIDSLWVSWREREDALHGMEDRLKRAINLNPYDSLEATLQNETQRG